MIVQPVHVVVGLLMRADKLLVAKRPQNKPYSGYWEFPGGKVEAQESSQEALHRELAEELGITVTMARRWFEHEHQYPDKQVHLELWLVDDFIGEPQPIEHEALRWSTLAEISALCILEGNWPILEKLKSILKPL